MIYRANKPPKRAWPRWFVWAALVGCGLFLALAVVVRQAYLGGLEPVDPQNGIVQTVVIEHGATLNEITDQLKQAGLIRSTWVFKWYASSHGVKTDLQAGTYDFSPSQATPEIIVQLSHGKVKINLVTIIPGQRLDQIRATLLNYGFKEADVSAALDPAQYSAKPVLADMPTIANLEGFIYPDSYQQDANTTAQQIVQQALQQMQQKLTPDLKTAFATEELSVYQGIILASIVEKETSKPEDRAQVAQVFLKRLQIGMQLGSDVTAYYGALLAGQEESVSYDSPYNTRLHSGLPPTPISNVTSSALEAVAHPAQTDWLYFVAGDDGTTHFAKTLAEHEANTAKYCIKLCGR